MLIMIDVKLTPSGLWWTAYLFVWMGRRRPGLVLLLAWWVLEDSGATSSICFWSLSLGHWLGCRLVFYFDIGLCCWGFTHLSGFKDFMCWCILILWHVYFRDVWLISVATVDESYICMLFEFWCEDVASISWIFILFACIIALIEIGRYTKGSSSYLVVFSDSDFASCKSDRKSTSGTCHLFGNCLISWHSKKQHSVTLSTTEAEYVAAGSCCSQI